MIMGFEQTLVEMWHLRLVILADFDIDKHNKIIVVNITKIFNFRNLKLFYLNYKRLLMNVNNQKVYFEAPIFYF